MEAHRVGEKPADTLSAERSRTVIENGVQSCLQVSSMFQDKVIKARLLRARARFAAGLRGAAHQGITVSVSGIYRPFFLMHVSPCQIYRLFSYSILATARLGSYCLRPLEKYRPRSAM